MAEEKRFRVLSTYEMEKALPDAEGFGYRDECQYLAEFVPGETPRLVGSDGGEPEDNSFYRDWAWVVGELNAAYERGLKDGKA